MRSPSEPSEAGVGAAADPGSGTPRADAGTPAYPLANALADRCSPGASESTCFKYIHHAVRPLRAWTGHGTRQVLRSWSHRARASSRESPSVTHCHWRWRSNSRPTSSGSDSVCQTQAVTAWPAPGHNNYYYCAVLFKRHPKQRSWRISSCRVVGGTSILVPTTRPPALRARTRRV